MQQMLRLAALCVCMLCTASCASSQGKNARTKTATPEQLAIAKADTALALGKRGEAMALYQAAADLPKAGVRAHLQLAALYEEQARRDDALHILRTAHAKSPTSVEVVKELSHLLLKTNRTAEADAYIAKGLVQSPNDVRLLNAQGIIHDRRGEHAKAQKRYRQALKRSSVDSDKEYTVNNLALSLVASGNAEEAVSLMKTHKHTAQNKVAHRQMLALAYGAMGDEDMAYELGLQDLSVEEVKENLHFYEQLRQKHIDPSILFNSSAK